ncbi:MAG: hypothetical protein J0H62_05090, partial [Rhizobiales bacterium]|nr:hypothetical protein [Hyphomicrobiales bacterium]
DAGDVGRAGAGAGGALPPRPLRPAGTRPLRRAATAQGIATNPAFSGTYRFEPTADFSVLFPGFLDRLPDCSVVMCHPGHVDEVLRLVDPLTDLREREYAYLASDRLPQDLASAGVALL